MITPRLALVGETVVRDAPTNQVSVFNIIDEVTAQTFPLLFPRLTALLILARESTDAAKHELKLVVTLDGKPLNEFPASLDFQKALVTRAILVIQGFVIPQAGRLLFDFQIDGPSLDRFELIAVLGTPPTPVVVQKCERPGRSLTE